MNGYTVFLGPITGIMITDVGLLFFALLLALPLTQTSDYDSTGSFTARMSMFPQCTGRMAGIGILMAWYGAFRRESDISTSSPQHFSELARGCRSAGFCTTKLSWAHKQHQNEGAHWHRRRASIRHCVLAWGECARKNLFFHNFRKLESGTHTAESNFCQFSIASIVYFTLSKLFPAHETMLERAILDKEETPSEHVSSGGIDDDEKQDRGPADVAFVQIT